MKQFIMVGVPGIPFGPGFLCETEKPFSSRRKPSSWLASLLLRVTQSECRESNPGYTHPKRA